MNIKRLFILTGTVFLGLTLVSIWIWYLSEPLVSAQAAGTWYVAPSGSDSNSCLSTTAPCVTDYKANANVYYVCAGTGCGISTTHSTINDALAVTIPGDSIYVAEGNYTESITLTESISLQGGWSRDFAVYSPTLNTSTIQGSGNQPVIRIEGGAAPLVQGFTITGGGTNYQIRGGAGISIRNGGTIIDNRIVQNTSEYSGGGISVENRSISNPIMIANNEIISNTSGDEGGGIRAGAVAGGKVIIQHNVIRGNVSEYGEGGGLSLGTDNNPTSSIVIDGNIIIANQSDYGYGGGVVMASRGISLTNNIIANNIATFGGGVYIIGGNPGASWLTNNTIVDNEDDGVAVTNCNGTVIHLTNNIIANNAGYGISSENVVPLCVPTVSYNDVWGNFSGNYCCNYLPDQTGTNGNISIDPHFVDPSNGDWHLQTCSPAVDAGTNTGAPSIDLEGDVRPFNGVTDMGADEYVGRECFRNFLPCVTNNYCPPLYSDDFSDPNSGWPVGDDGNIRYEYLNGEYRIKVYNDWWAAARPGFQASDYILAADVRVPFGSNGSYGLIFGISSDWSQFYTFEIDKFGNYGMYRYDSESWTLLAEGWSVEINTDTNVKNRLKIKREGTLIEAYANGHLLASISDGAYTGMRYMGLFINNYNLGGYEVMFDDFGVYPMTCNMAADQSGMAIQAPTWKSLESIEQGQTFSQPNSRKR